MNLIQLLRGNTEKLDIEKVFNVSENENWIWLNKSIFSDIFYALNEEIEDIEEEDEEDIAQSNILDVSESEVFDIVEELLKKQDYFRINQYLFSSYNKDYKVTKDIETIIFIKREYYIKMSIAIHKEFDWLLKAMAVDTYSKSIHKFKKFRLCYEELYSENYRIIEELLSGYDYQHEENTWRYIHKISSLEFEKAGKVMRMWSKGEAESNFNSVYLK